MIEDFIALAWWWKIVVIWCLGSCGYWVVRALMAIDKILEK